jgi:hypothetical protein
MPRGVPKAGFRQTKNQKNGPVITTNLPVAQLVMTKETDAEIEQKLNERFTALEKMSNATINGKNRAMIVSGPAGVGKSYSIMKTAESLKNSGKQIEIVRGFVRPTGLYKILYENRHKHCVVIFDDADSVFLDDISLNILKTACDMTRTRTLSWLAETNMTDEADERIPRQFEFEGAVIFITNYDFDYLIEKGNKLSPHLNAMVSRSLYLDLAMKSQRDYVIRIKQVVGTGMLRDAGMSASEEKMILDFIDKNADRLRELSLRMVVKLANIYRIDPKTFDATARMTCFKSR